MTPFDTPPRRCPECGTDLSDHPYDRLEPGKAAQALRKVAVLLLPVLAIAYLVQLFWGGSNLGFGTGAGYYAIAWICGPSLLLYAISRLLPRVRRVICLRCSWNQEFPIAEAARGEVR